VSDIGHMTSSAVSTYASTKAGWHG